MIGKRDSKLKSESMSLQSGLEWKLNLQNTGISIGIGITWCWNRNQNQNFWETLESESKSESLSTGIRIGIGIVDFGKPRNWNQYRHKPLWNRDWYWNHLQL